MAFASILEDIKTYSGISRILAVAFNLFRKILLWIGRERLNEIFSCLGSFSLALTTSDGRFFIRPLDGTDAFVLREVIKRRVYEKKFAPSKGEKVVDVGAHIGAFTVRVGKLVGKEGLVVSIEPNPHSYKLLVKNIQLNQLRNVIPLNQALGKIEAVSSLFTPLASAGNSSLFPRKESTYRTACKVEKLDSLLRRLGIGKIDFLKIDVEGAELDVLEGSKMTLGSKGFKIVLEVHDENKSHVVNFLKAKGFIIYDIGTIVYAINVA